MVLLGLLILGVPVAVIAFLVTLPMRTRLRRTMDRVAALSEAQSRDTARLEVLLRRMDMAERLLSTRAPDGRAQPAGDVRREEPPAPEPIIIPAAARQVLPDVVSHPEAPLVIPRVAAKAARPRQADAISEIVPIALPVVTTDPDKSGEIATLPLGASVALVAASAETAPTETGSPAPAAMETQQETRQETLQETPAPIIISADAWTGRSQTPAEAAPPGQAAVPSATTASDIETPTAPPEAAFAAAPVAAGAEDLVVLEAGARDLGDHDRETQDQEALQAFPEPEPFAGEPAAALTAALEVAAPEAPVPAQVEEPALFVDENASARILAVPAISLPAEHAEPAAAVLPGAIREEAGAVGRAFRSGAEVLARLSEGDASRPRNWETLIGGRWLNLIGMVLLVIGVVLLTQQAFHYLDPRGKIAVGVAFALLLLLCGILLEHRTVYRRIGSTLVGGGWALLYFDAYAAANIEQVKVIEDPTTSLAAMAAVAAGMVAHSLRYRSQWITAIAFGLGYLAVLLTPVSLQSLVASALLAGGLAVVSWAMSWQYLLGTGVIAAYSNHWFWLQKVAVAQGAAEPTLIADSPGRGFWISSAILVFYWAIFAAVSLSRRMDKEMNRQLHLSVGVANAVGMLGLVTLQLVQGYGGHYLGFVTAPAALGYVVLAAGERRLGQRVPFLFAASLALLLYSVTLPLARVDLAIDLAWLAPVLLAGGLAALVTGSRVGEVLLRGEGLLAAAASFVMLSAYNLEQPGAAEVSTVWFAAPAMAAAYQVASEWCRRPAGAAMPDLRAASWGFGVAASLSLAHLLWVQVPLDLVGLACLASGLVAWEAGARLDRIVLRSEAYLLTVLACAALLLFNLGPQAMLPAPAMPRSVVLLAAAAGLYGLSWRLMAGTWASVALERMLAWIPSAAGSAVAVALAVDELPPALVCAALALWAIVLFETALRATSLPLRLQAYAVMACAIIAAAAVNGVPAPFGSAPGPLTWGSAAITIAAGWWFYRRLVLQHPAVHATEVLLGGLATVAVNAISAELLWKLLPADLVGLAWIAGGILLYEVALRLDQALLRLQAYAVLALSFLLLLSVNFGLGLPQALAMSRWLSVGPAVLVYYAFSARLEQGARPRLELERDLTWVPSALASALVVLLAWFGLEPNVLTAALAAWALVLVETGLRFGRLPIRIQGYALMALAVLAALRFNGYPAPDGSAPGPGSWGPVLVTVALLVWHFRRFAVPRVGQHAMESWIPEAASAAATLLLVQILLKELPVDRVGLAWLALGVLLFEASAPARRIVLRIEGYAVQGLAFLALLTVNCGSTVPLSDSAGPRWPLVIPAIAGFYLVSGRMLSGAAGVSAQERTAGWVPSVLASALVVALAVHELNPALLTAALSLWGLVLFEAGLRTRQDMIRYQGYAFAGGATLLALVTNIAALPLGSGAPPAPGLAEWLPVLVTSGVLAWLFLRLAVRPAVDAWIDVRLGHGASAAASLLLALLAWKEMPSLAVAVLWCGLGFALFQLSGALRVPLLRAQGHLLLGAGYGRLYMANFVSLDQAGPVSLRVVTVLPVLLALYCVLEQLRSQEPATDQPGWLGRVLRFEARTGSLAYSWAGFLGLVVLCRFEFGREHTVAAWSALVLLFILLGQSWDRQDFRFQSYALAILSAFRAWATNLHMDGTWLGLPERISTTLPMIAVLFVAAVAIAGPRPVQGPPGRSRITRLLNGIDARGHTFFALLASAFTAILLYYQLDANTLSIGLALEGFCLLALGFVLNDRVFRLFGLALLLACLVKLMVYDLRGIETIYRILSFIVLGLVLLLASFGYARYRDKIEKLI